MNGFSETAAVKSKFIPKSSFLGIDIEFIRRNHTNNTIIIIIIISINTMQTTSVIFATGITDPPYSVLWKPIPWRMRNRKLQQNRPKESGWLPVSTSDWPSTVLNLSNFCGWYCWWKKSCTTWDVWNPVNNGIRIIIILGGAGFQPSTVARDFNQTRLQISTDLHISAWLAEKKTPHLTNH